MISRWIKPISISGLYLLISLLVASLCSSTAQERSRAIIQGQVSDSTSGAALENAIVFIENSPFGTSSGKDGSYSLESIPVGSYHLIISRVGYQSVTIAVAIDHPGSIFLPTKLIPTVLSIPEVEVVGGSPETHPAGVGTQLGFFPVSTPEVLGIYGVSAATPLSLIHTDSAIYIVSLDTEFVADEKYVRLWVLYLNLTDTIQDFFPARDIRLTVISDNSIYRGIAPEQNEWVRSVLDTGRVDETFSNSIYASLESMARRRTEYLYDDGVFLKLLALRGLLQANLTRTRGMPTQFTPSRDESLSGRLYDLYSRSLYVRLLARYSVYPGNSLHGHLFFPHPGLGWEKEAETTERTVVYRYEVTMTTSTGAHSILFLAR